MIDREGKYLGGMASSHLRADVASRLRYRGVPYFLVFHPRPSA